MSEEIAVVGNNALTEERDPAKSLGELATGLEAAAMSISVKNETDVMIATNFKKQVAQVKKRVTEYWEPLRVDAKKAYDTVLEKKKEMLGPVERAEKIISGKLGDYAYKIELKRRAEEAARQKALEEATSAKLEEAARAESAGDAIGADMAMAEAEVYDSLSAQTQEAPAKISGMTQKLGWEIVSLSPGLVPINICGQEVHITNKAVVEQLVRKAIEQADGKISIPGVVFKETMKVSTR